MGGGRRRGGRGTADGRMRRWGGRSYCERGSGERMDANAFIGRGCSVIAQAARGRGERELEGEERERVTFSLEERR